MRVGWMAIAAAELGAGRGAGPDKGSGIQAKAAGDGPLARAGGRRSGPTGPLRPLGPAEAAAGGRARPLDAAAAEAATAAAWVSAWRLPAIVVVMVTKEESDARPSLARDPGTLTSVGIARRPCTHEVKGRLRTALAGRNASLLRKCRACSPVAAKASAIPAISRSRSPRARCQFQNLGGPFGCWD